MTSTAATAALQAMTAKGTETMTAIGRHELSFFDEGIQEHSGIWGSCLAQEMGHRSSGVINRLRDLGLFTTSPAGEGDDSDWWALTALGAEVANTLAAPTTTTKENDMTENTTAKPAAAKKETAAKKAAAPAKVRAYKVPKGYEVKWQHGGHDLLKKADAATKGPAWFTACNEHGDLHEAANAKEAEGFGVLKVRATWCKGDHKPAAKKAAAPAKKAAAKKSPTKAKATASK